MNLLFSEDSENFMDNIPTDHEELNNFLDDLMAQRKTINDKIHSVVSVHLFLFIQMETSLYIIRVIYRTLTS